MDGPGSGRWRPPQAPRQAERSVTPWRIVRRWRVPGPGPEDVRCDSRGRVLTGLADGRIVRLDPDTGRVDVVADTGGRPLGLHPVSDDELLVADARRGLLRIGGLERGAPRVEVLVREIAGGPLGTPSNVVAAPDGTIWFTVSSTRHPVEGYTRDLLEHSGTGRVLRLPPGGRAEVVRAGLTWANGVAVTPAGDALWVAETGGYRLHRLRLTGPGAGAWDVPTANLPGFPDNVSVGAGGRLWVAMAARRNPLLDRLLAAPPGWRRPLLALPPRLVEGPRSPAAAVAVDLATGAVLADLAASGRREPMPMTTSVLERDGRLLLGSVHGRWVGVATLP